MDSRIPFGPGATDFAADLGNEYQLFQASAHNVTICPKGPHSVADQIPDKVVSCNSDDYFIIAKQQDRDKEGKPLADRYHYWILQFPGKFRHGPLTEEQFAAKRKVLGVPESLKLRDISSYRS